VATALILHYGFAILGITPESGRAAKEVAQFKLDYTFWMNLAAAAPTAGLMVLNRAWHRHNNAMAMDMGGGTFKKVMARLALGLLAAGMALYFYSQIF